MPTYKYKCEGLDCQHEFIELQNMNDKPLEDCPKCGRKNLKRLIGAGLEPIYKGKGFYTTDYKKKGAADV